MTLAYKHRNPNSGIILGIILKSLVMWSHILEKKKVEGKGWEDDMKHATDQHLDSNSTK